MNAMNYPYNVSRQYPAPLMGRDSLTSGSGGGSPLLAATDLPSGSLSMEPGMDSLCSSNSPFVNWLASTCGSPLSGEIPNMGGCMPGWKQVRRWQIAKY